MTIGLTYQSVVSLGALTPIPELPMTHFTPPGSHNPPLPSGAKNVMTGLIRDSGLILLGHQGSSVGPIDMFFDGVQYSSLPLSKTFPKLWGPSARLGGQPFHRKSTSRIHQVYVSLRSSPVLCGLCSSGLTGHAKHVRAPRRFGSLPEEHEGLHNGLHPFGVVIEHTLVIFG